MKRIGKTLAVVVGAGLLMVVGAMLGPRTAHAVVGALVQIVPGTTTHVGQNESQLVSLACEQGTEYCVAIDPEGDYSTTGYVVPSGYTLIVTDWQWTVSGATPGVRWADRLYIVVTSGFPLGLSSTVMPRQIRMVTPMLTNATQRVYGSDQERRSQTSELMTTLDSLSFRATWFRTEPGFRPTLWRRPRDRGKPYECGPLGTRPGKSFRAKRLHNVDAGGACRREHRSDYRRA